MINRPGPLLEDKEQVAPRVQSVADDLARRIRQGRLRRGQRLPSIRTLAGQFDVSFGTVQAAMKYLERLGLVEGHHGSGVYVSHRGNGTRTLAQQSTLVYVLVHTRSKLFLWMMQPLVKALQQSSFVPVPVIYNEDDPAEIAHLPAMWAEHPPRAVIAKGYCVNLARAVAENSPQGTRLISVYVGGVPPVRHWHNVFPDEVASYRLATQTLLSRGHKRLGVLTAPRGPVGPKHPHLARMANAHILGAIVTLREAGMSNGLTVHRIPREDDQRNLGMDPACTDRVAQWLRRPDGPTGLIMTTSRLPVVQLAAAAAGLAIGRDLDVIAVGSDEPARQGVCDCIDEQHSLLVDEVIRMVSADDPDFDRVARHVLVPPRFVPRQPCDSTAAASGAGM